jgi:hypothetical protein
VGIAVYLENQVHDRSLADPRVWDSLTRLLAVASPDGLLAAIPPYGDTMFNSVQLDRLIRELEAIAEGNPSLVDDVDALKSAANAAIRQRGYLWFCGD